MQRFIAFSIIILFAFALPCCKKDTARASEVFIRVENATAENFSNFTLNTTDFGGISSGAKSGYILCKSVLPIPFANYVAINNISPYIVDIVPTPYMNTGNYLLRIETDVSPYHYKASFIKE